MQGEEFQIGNRVIISYVDDICQLSLKNLTDEEVKLMQFVSLTWHEFYCWFAKFNGFTVRKGNGVEEVGYCFIV